MPQKIKILKLTKPQEYIQRELDILKGRKNKLLSSSDWTQIIDSGLSTRNVLEWRFWRSLVRSVDTNDILTFGTTKERLAFLETKKPTTVKRGNEDFVFIPYDFNHSSLDNFAKSCMIILSGQSRISAAVMNKVAKKMSKAKTYTEVFDHFIKEF